MRTFVIITYFSCTQMTQIERIYADFY